MKIESIKEIDNKRSPFRIAGRSKRNLRKKRKRLFFYGMAVIVFVLVLLYLGISFYYNGHFFPRTTVNGVAISNKTITKAEDVINAQVRAYTLTLEVREGPAELIAGDDINLHIVFDSSLVDDLESQNGFAWVFALLQSKEWTMDTMLEYDEDSLQSRFQELSCLQEENMVEPTNAAISEYSENGYEVIPETQGSTIDSDQLYEAVKEAIMSLEPTLSIEETGGYIEPEVTSDSPELINALVELNTMANAKITYEFGEDTEVVDTERIIEWLSVDENYEVSISDDGIKEFVDYIGKTYNTFGKVRTFQTSYGDVLDISGGDYGWWLDRSTEASDLKELIQNGEQLVREPAYFQTAQQYGDDDIGDTYVEVNLTAQHLFFYKEGSLILESDFVSGNLTKNNGTPTGTYPVQYKEREATLVGEDYETPVEYWMPFNGNIGLHDASWRSDFGKAYYLTSGSHGCINMPPSAAKTMYENISRGVAVVVYELPGTENYDTSDSEIQSILEAIAKAKAEAEAEEEEETQEQEESTADSTVAQ